MKARLTLDERAALSELLWKALELTRQLDDIESTIALMLDIERDDEGVITDAVCGAWTADQLLVRLHIEAA